MCATVELSNKDDFYWHKQNLDVKARYKHKHIGEPKEYPCRVFSVWSDNPNGPYEYEHHFVYRQKTTCPNCGHSESIWPEGLDDFI